MNYEYDALVTGASGFIGKHLVKYLRLKNKRIVVVDINQYQNNASNHTNQIKYVNWDILKKSLPLPSCRTWYHLAAKTDIRYCNKYPKLANEINAKSLNNVLSVAGSSDYNSFVLVSTLGVYGNPNYFPTDETHPLQPIEVYSISKAKAEKILKNYPKTKNKKHIIVRLFNTYGPGQKESMLIPTLINQINDSNKLTIRNLDCTRDFVYIDDIVRGIYDSGTKAKNGDIINLGTGIETSIESLIDSVTTIIGRKIIVEVQESKSSVPIVERSQSDIQKANSVLSWYPEISLNEGLKRLINNRNYLLTN